MAKPGSIRLPVEEAPSNPNPAGLLVSPAPFSSPSTPSVPVQMMRRPAVFGMSQARAIGVAVAVAGVPPPRPFTARTWKAYCVPFSSPVTKTSVSFEGSPSPLAPRNSGTSLHILESGTVDPGAWRNW